MGIVRVKINGIVVEVTDTRKFSPEMTEQEREMENLKFLKRAKESYLKYYGELEKEEKHAKYVHDLLDNTPKDEWVYRTNDNLEVTVNNKTYKFKNNAKTLFKLPPEISNMLAKNNEKQFIKHCNRVIAQRKRRERERRP